MQMGGKRHSTAGPSCLDKQGAIFCKVDTTNGSEPAEVFLAFFASSGPQSTDQLSGGQGMKKKTMIHLNKATVVSFVALGLTCFWISPVARAVSPPPDGGYPGDNTAEGEDSLFNLTTGRYNTAVGFSALFTNTTASFNTAIGTATLLANTGDENTATGAGALLFNTTGRENTAVEAFALIENRDGFDNTAVGERALGSNISGISNIAIGALAMQNQHLLILQRSGWGWSAYGQSDHWKYGCRAPGGELQHQRRREHCSRI
jgi:hypothetical protein